MNIIITGGSKGIGFEIVKRLYENNKITILSRTLGKLNPEIIKSENINWIEVDLSDESKYGFIREQLKEKSFDILINNAAGGAHTKIQKFNMKKITESINLNIKQVMWITHIISKNMIKNKTGLIINIASIHALTGNPNSSLYSATKFALRGFSESLYYELKKHNIKVTTIYPDYVNTDLLPNNIRGREKMLQPSSMAILIENIIKLPKEMIIKDLTVSSTL